MHTDLRTPLLVASSIMLLSSAVKARAPRMPLALPATLVEGTLVETLFHPEIRDLSRALHGDVDLIYGFVRDHIAFEPTWGLRKGAHGTLLDGSGNSFDQAALMVALLRASDDPPANINFVRGVLSVKRSESPDNFDELMRSWFGIDTTKRHPQGVLSYGGIPKKKWYGPDMQEEQRDCVHGQKCVLNHIMFQHVWVEVTLDGHDEVYVFDPSLAPRDYVDADADLGTILGYDRQALVATATATGTHSNVSTIGLDRDAIRRRLIEYTSNLVSYLRNERPSSSLREILGGLSHGVPVQRQLHGHSQRDAEHPYALSENDPILTTDSYPGWAYERWNGRTTMINQNYVAKLTIRHGSDSEFQFEAHDVYGKTLSISFKCRAKYENNSKVLRQYTTPSMWVDGLLSGEGNEFQERKLEGPGRNEPFKETEITVLAQIPAYEKDTGTFLKPYEKVAGIHPKGRHAIVHVWGSVGPKHIERHQRRLRYYETSDDPRGDSDSLTESLAMIGTMYFEQVSDTDRLASMVTGIYLFGQVGIAVASLEGAGTVTIDVMNWFLYWSPSILHMLGHIKSALEHSVIEQAIGVKAMSTIGVLDHMIASGELLFMFNNCDSFRDFVLTLEQIGGYTNRDDDDDIPRFRNSICDQGGYVILPATKYITVGNWSGYAWDLNGSMKVDEKNGGIATENAEPQPEELVCIAKQPDKAEEHEDRSDPIDFVSGYWFHRHTDISVGNGPMPFGLAFDRYYSSGEQRIDAPFGSGGWRHNYDVRAITTSGGLRGLRQGSAVDAAPAVVAQYVLYDLAKDAWQFPQTAVSLVVTKWLTDQLTNNAVLVDIPGNGKVFRR